MNPLLNVSALNCNEIVRGILNNVSKHVDGASVEQIKLRVRLEGGSLKFALNFAKGSPQQFWEIITRPLCISSMELIRQNKILVDLVRRKDEEIAEYKAEGAELIRSVYFFVWKLLLLVSTYTKYFIFYLLPQRTSKQKLLRRNSLK